MKKLIAFLVMALTLNVAFTQSTVTVTGYLNYSSDLPLKNYRVIGVCWRTSDLYYTQYSDTTYTNQNGIYSFIWANDIDPIIGYRISIVTNDPFRYNMLTKGFDTGAPSYKILNFPVVYPVSTEFNTDTVTVIDSTNVSIQNLEVSKTFLSNNILSISTHNISIISIYNVTGQLVYQETTKENSLIDLSDLKSGLYFARIKEGINENTIKFIK